MKIRTYLWVDGEHFDPDSFNDGLSADLKGEVLFRKRVVDGIVEDAGKYWRSKVIEVPSGYPEESLGILLTALRSEILRIRDLQSMRIIAEVVAEYDESDSLRGYFFSAEIIQMLSDLRAGLDIDVVRSLN